MQLKMFTNLDQERQRGGSRDERLSAWSSGAGGEEGDMNIEHRTSNVEPRTMNNSPPFVIPNPITPLP
jgi:hypothetical protein